MSLAPPPTNFSTLALPTRQVSVEKLFRVSRRDKGEPYFGRNRAYRFDDPEPNPASRFGACYCGFDLDTAVAESILHDELAQNGGFDIAESEFTTRYLVRFKAAATGGMLTLADLTGHGLKKLGGDNSISSENPYNTTQEWSKAVHVHPANVDGILFVSRQLNTKKAVVIFDRAKAKFGTPSYAPLSSVRSLGRTKTKLGIRVVYP